MTVLASMPEALPDIIRGFPGLPGNLLRPLNAAIQRVLSRGYVLARTPDPHDQPAINPRYLAEDTDRRAIVGGFKFLRRLFAAPAMALEGVTRHPRKSGGPGELLESLEP